MSRSLARKKAVDVPATTDDPGADQVATATVNEGRSL
jgi:hypothetical protein